MYTYVFLLSFALFIRLFHKIPPLSHTHTLHRYMRLHFFAAAIALECFSTYSHNISYNHIHNHKMERYCGQMDESKTICTSIPAINKFSPQVNISWPPFFYLSFSFYLFCSRFSFIPPFYFSLTYALTPTSLFQYAGDIIASCIKCKLLYFIG